MSTITALLTGTLAQVPVSRTTAKGGTMATSSVATQASNDGKPVYIGVMAFGDLADELSQLVKGDAVSVRGRMELSRWTTPEGEQRDRWQVIADSLLAGPEKPSRASTATKQEAFSAGKRGKTNIQKAFYQRQKDL